MPTDVDEAAEQLREEAEEAVREEQRQAENAAKVATKVERAAKRGFVRGGPDGPEELNFVRPPRDKPNWTRGDDPEAAAAALAEASLGTTGGPFAGSYDHAAQRLAEEPVSEEERIAAQHRDYEAAHPEVSEEEAQAKADADAAAKAEAKANATKAPEAPAEGETKEAGDSK